MRARFWILVLVLASAGGLLGGFNMMWIRHPPFPAYGYIIDLIAVPAVVAGLLYVRRIKAATMDEFMVTKKRFAAQSGFVIGFLLFALSGVIPLIFPQAYHQFLAGMDGANEGFIMGRVFGMAPFVVGLLLGQVGAWLKYR
jgi:uncharacterized protein YjeT (DUF2065 family)